MNPLSIITLGVDDRDWETYNTAIFLRSVYRGKINITYDDLYVDYASNALAYVVDLSGDCRYTEVTGRGRKAGHFTTQDGVISSYAESTWDEAGVPSYVRTHDIYGVNHRRALCDCHWAYYPIYQ